MANCNDCICSEVCYYKAFNDERILKKRRDDVEKNCKSFVHRDSLKNAHTVDAVELPCNVGDKVYRIDAGNYSSDWKPFVQELTVTEIRWKKEKYGDKDLGFAIIANGIRYKFTSIGKSVFLTRKEAEAKLGGDNDG